MTDAKVFAQVEKMKVGDYFLISVLNHTMKYKVDQIKIVLPDEVKDLKIIKGKDLATLITCTPIGLNSHRLLVRGYRVPVDGDRVTAEVNHWYKQLIAGVLGFLALVIFLGLLFRKKKKLEVEILYPRPMIRHNLGKAYDEHEHTRRWK
jgi:sortase A